MSGIRAALFGVRDKHAGAHLKTLQVMDEVSEILLWDEDRDALRRVHSERGMKVTAVYTDRDELLANEKVHFAIAAVRNDKSAEMCTRLVEAGVHVMSEKPIGLDAQETAGVVKAAERAGVQLGVCYQNRYNPVSLEARRLTQEGIIGRVTSCEARMVTSQVRFRNPKGWLFDKAKAGGGILAWLGCHYVDLLRFVLDDEVASVVAFSDTASGEAIDVEDVAVLALRFRRGTLGTLTAGYQLALSDKGGPNYDTYLAFRGTAGQLNWSREQPPALHVESTNDNWAAAPIRRFEYELAPSPAYAGTYGLQFMRRFLASLHG